MSKTDSYKRFERSKQFRKLHGKPESALRTAIACALSVALAQAPFASLPAGAQNSGKTVPSGTLLLPLTPKLDGDAAAPSALAPVARKEKPKKIAVKSSTSTAKEILGPIPASPAEAPAAALPASPAPPAEPPMTEGAAALKDAGKAESTENRDPDEPDVSSIESVTDNSLLKGTVQIVADDTEYDQLKNTFLGTGNAVATIAGQNAKLEADMILYDQQTEMLDARGNVKIIRQDQVSTGSSFKFKVSSDEYLITSPDTAVQGTQVVSRTGYGNKTGMRFREGTLELPEPVRVSRNAFYGTANSMNESFYKSLHPQAYMPEKPSFTFKAKKMVYEKYKESGNLTVFGGKLMFGQFGVPIGKFTATVGQESRVTFPVTPFFGNNLMVGGNNIGPMFNTALPGDRVFSWAPLLQLGGRTDSSTDSNPHGSIGGGVRIAFRGKKWSGNLAYGSVSNILVGDLKYRFNPNRQFQAGINRFLPNGLFGSQRARAIAEFVDTKGISNIPFLQGLSFRTSAGWASDNPALLNQTPQYKELFTVNHGNIVNAYRLQEQVMGSTQPLFAVGDQKVGLRMNLFGGLAGRAYSTGDSMLMAQAGPVMNLYLNRLRLSGSLIKSGVSGQSPFVFDEFIQGAKSGQLGGSFKVCKWFDIGGNLGYNMDNKLFYQKSIAAAFGPEDFKFMVQHDTIRGINRFGFDFMYGQPMQFNKLIMKASPDQGQLSGI